MISLVCVIILAVFCLWLSDQNRKLKDELTEQLYINRLLSIEAMDEILEEDEEWV